MLRRLYYTLFAIDWRVRIVFDLFNLKLLREPSFHMAHTRKGI